MNKYWDNKESHGIIYDWQKILKEYNKLHIPKEFYQPVNVPFNNAKWIVELSERRSGKSTNWLLLGMVMNKMYGTIIQYVRQTENMIMPVYSEELFAVIKSYDNGKYIRQITDNKYNSCIYYRRKMYYCNVDSDGNEIDRCPTHFLQFLSVDNTANYKSGYNCPTGDLIIFDEFIGKFDRLNEFVDFCDLLSTIIRYRKSPVIALLANTINLNHNFFKELCITKEIRSLKVGQHKTVTSSLGTNVYVELIGVKTTSIKSEINKLFFGFDNPKLASITGGEQPWAFENVPHIWHEDNEVYINRDIRLDCDGTFIQLDLVKCERGIVVYAHECTRNYPRSIILTTGDITEKNQMYGLGSGKLCDLLWKLKHQNKWYYSNNEIGAFVTNYLDIYRQKRI